MTTLKDIAKVANVNVSTVSKALRNSNDLNIETITLIRRIADEMKYPYSSVISKSTKDPVIGIVCPEIISSYYTNIIDSFNVRVRDEGYNTIFSVSDFSSERELECIRLLIKSNVCGIVCFTENSVNVSAVKEIADSDDITFLFVSTAGDIINFDSISIDDHHSAMIAVNHLTGLGHKRIAYIGDRLSSIRKKSFLTALSDTHIVPVENFIIESDLRFEECGYEGMKYLLSLNTIPTGVFAAYDNIAIGAMRAIYEAGLSIPDDISVVSIDNIKTSAYLYKGLTTVTEPTSDLGEIASSLIIDKIRDRNRTVQSIKLRPTLNIRETTAKPKLLNLQSNT